MAAARRDGATTEVASGDRDREAWRSREAALRADHDREMAALRSRHAAEVDEERRRGAATLRSELQRYADDVAKTTVEWQTRLDEALRRQLAERDEWAKRMAEAVAAEGKVRRRGRGLWLAMAGDQQQRRRQWVRRPPHRWVAPYALAAVERDLPNGCRQRWPLRPPQRLWRWR